MPRYFLGIDVSTTATKALLIDEQGGVVAGEASTYPYETPHPLWSEQHPHLWWEAAQKAIRGALQRSELSPSDIAAVGLTGQMHGLVLLDRQGDVLRPAILWNDGRTAAQCAEIHERMGRERFLDITGNLALTGFTAPKVLWVAENEPEIYAKVAHLLLPKDYVRLKLTGEFAMDVADGAGTVLMDLKARQWSEEVLSALQISPAWLPALYEGPAITGRITAEAAAETGLLPGTVVIAGGGDQAAGAVGVGAVEPGILSLALGTSGVVFAPTNSPVIEPEGRLHAFCHAVPNQWHLMGVMLSAAGSLRWYRDTFAPGLGFDELIGPVNEVPAGSEGLLFLPYLTGERTPYPDPLARGAFVGLTVRHGLPHLTRAVLEGVAFGLRDCLELVRQSGVGEIRQVRISGGGARNASWRQIIADVLGAELVTVNTSEGAAYGAALLAGVGAGRWQSVEAACINCVQVTSSTVPDPAAMDTYAPVYAEYHGLYSRLKSTFAAEAGF